MQPNTFPIIACLIQGIIFVLFIFFVRYEDQHKQLVEIPASTGGSVSVEATTISATSYTYPAFQDVHVMMFIGFGFLMTFLRRYGFSAVGYNMLIAAMVLQWALLCRGFWERVYTGHWERIAVSIPELVSLDFASASVLIAFGAIIGKTSPSQLLFIAFIQVIVYTCNEMILVSCVCCLC